MVDLANIDAEGRRRRNDRGYTPETANNTPEPTVNKKDFNKREETQEISYPSRDTFLKYPVDNNFPVSMLYRVREVVPPIQGALEQVNEVYSNYAPDDMVYVQSKINVKSEKKETVNNKNDYLTTEQKRDIERKNLWINLALELVC